MEREGERWRDGWKGQGIAANSLQVDKVDMVRSSKEDTEVRIIFQYVVRTDIPSFQTPSEGTNLPTSREQIHLRSLLEGDSLSR